MSKYINGETLKQMLKTNEINNEIRLKKDALAKHERILEAIKKWPQLATEKVKERIDNEDTYVDGTYGSIERHTIDGLNIHESLYNDRVADNGTYCAVLHEAVKDYLNDNPSMKPYIQLYDKWYENYSVMSDGKYHLMEGGCILRLDFSDDNNFMANQKRRGNEFSRLI